jgi:hypothetical protein
MRRAEGTASHAKAPCTTRARARKAALMRRKQIAHTLGPSRARAALRAAGDNEAMPRPTARGRALAELKAAPGRGEARQGERAAGAGPRPHQSRATTAGRTGTRREGGRVGRQGRAGCVPWPARPGRHGRGKAGRRGWGRGAPRAGGARRGEGLGRRARWERRPS